MRFTAKQLNRNTSTNSKTFLLRISLFQPWPLSTPRLQASWPRRNPRLCSQSSMPRRRVPSLRSSRRVHVILHSCVFLHIVCECVLSYVILSLCLIMHIVPISVNVTSFTAGARLSYSQVLPQWESNRIWRRQVIELYCDGWIVDYC